ncbi:Uncharacterized protein PECH_007403 [Penicillium ucsense]|uniref:Uncharacterized protein n=1 Tax=Penicillium ucsense TaxID=2839758 RepID=A0A8J8WKJ9_9EURO|nr:Uncharacterized protein PECM_000091 [Penicillium ucsense]KAF7734863.1 Uncharacterized protein PECH_007403 [Penicillium ucsense]
MSTLNNPDSVTNQGAFKPSVAPEAPLTQKGHQVGRKVNEADQRSEFHMEKHPLGTAPAGNSYSANAQGEVGSQANNPAVMPSDDKEGVYTSAADTMTGSTSADLHTGMGKPIGGQTSSELAHDGAHGRKKQGSGLEGVGSSMDDRSIERDMPNQRGLEREQNVSGQRGNKADRSAADMRPESAETVAAEWKYEPSTKR